MVLCGLFVGVLGLLDWFLIIVGLIVGVVFALDAGFVVGGCFFTGESVCFGLESSIFGVFYCVSGAVWGVFVFRFM